MNGNRVRQLKDDWPHKEVIGSIPHITAMANENEAVLNLLAEANFHLNAGACTAQPINYKCMISIC